MESFLTDKKKIMISENYTNIFYSHLALRQNCYKCPYASVSRVADLTIGDFWGIENVDAEFYDKNGVSLVFANSETGKKMLQRIADSVDMREYDVKQCLQPNLQHPTKCPDEYQNFWEFYDKNGFKESVEKYCNFDENGYITIFRLMIKKVKNKFCKLISGCGKY